MSDETNSEVKAEAVAEVPVEVVAEVETKPETKPETTFFDVFDEVVAPEPPLVPEPPAEEPVSEDGSFFYKEHHVRFNEAGDCFIAKDGQCLGCPETNAVEAQKLIDEKLKGE